MVLRDASASKKKKGIINTLANISFLEKRKEKRDNKHPGKHLLSKKMKRINTLVNIPLLCRHLTSSLVPMVETWVTSAVELKASILNHLLGIFYHLLKQQES